MDLKIKRLSWAQSLFDDYESDEIAVTAGLGAGKSHAFYQWFLLRCLHNQHSANSCIVYPTYAEIKSFGIERFVEILAESGLQDGKHFEYYTGSNDPRVILKLISHTARFISGDRPSRLRAYEYSHAGVDEAGDCKPDVFKLLPTRVRCRRAQRRQIMWLGAPQGINEFANRFDSDDQEGWLKSAENDHYKLEMSEGRQRRIRRIRLKTDDNPHLPADYIPNLMASIGHNKNLVRSYRYGYFCPLFEGSAYHFDEERHAVETDASPMRPIILTWDFNIELVWTALQVVPFIDEYGKRSMRYEVIGECESGCDSFDAAIISFIRQFPDFDGWSETPIEVYGDRSGHAHSHKAPLTDFERIRDELKKFYKNVTLEASRRVAPEIGSVEAVNKMFSYDKLVVNPACRGLIRSLQATTWKEGKRKLHKPTDDTWTHRGDSLKYAIYQLEVMDALEGGKQRILRL